MPIEKEFGKLTHSQFAKLVSSLPEVRGQMKELPELLSQKKDRLKELLGSEDYSWGDIYELPFLEQMASLFVLLGLHVPLHEAALSEDPQEAVTRWGEPNSPLDAWFATQENEIEWKHLVWLTVVLQRNILSIMLYGQSLGALVEHVRQGNDESFFKAVRIDRTVLLAAPCADRLSKAELTNDKEFFRHLCRALKGLSKKHMIAIQDLRYSIVALRECGFDRFSDEDLERLFVKTRLYPNNAGALKNLRKHIQESRKIKTT
jgi:hypothetical protein